MAAKGGGAWKVAYADFVTAMMAFFLVMWICGQDQKIRRTVSDYFADPLGTEGGSMGKRATRTGALAESVTAGSVPMEERVALGRGRKSHSKERMRSPATKQVYDWIVHDNAANKYWQKQAQDKLESARWSKQVREDREAPEKVAAAALVKQLEEEITRDVPAKTDSFYRDLLLGALRDVNWMEIAEDLIGAQ